MKIVSNTKLIRRNKKIGQFLTVGALVVLGIGLYFSFTQPEQITITFGALLFGFLMTQIGIYFGNRWGKSPRPDELITAALKGLEDKYTLYHYVTSIPHTLIGPAGIFAFIPITVAGNISFDEKRQRFRQKGGNFYLKLFGQENLGRPEMDARYSVDDLTKYLKKILPETELPPIEPVLVFTNKKATVDTEGASIDAVVVDKLKDYIRKRSKDKSVPLTTITMVQKSMPNEDVE